MNDSDRMPMQDMHARATDGSNAMAFVIRTPIKAGRHLAIWLLYQSTGVSLLPPRDGR